MDSKKIIPFFWIFVLFLLQNAVGLFIPQRTPALLLLAILFYALSEGPVVGALLGIFAGVLLEIFGQGRMGCEILVLASTGFIFGKGGSAFFRESVFSQFLFPVLAFHFMVFLRLAIYQVFSSDPFDLSLLGAALLPYDVLIIFTAAPVLFFFLRKVSGQN